MKLCIDPGHGGDDAGVVVGELVEKDVNLAVASQLRRALLGAGWFTPSDAALTREGDENVTLRQRGKVSVALGGDLVFSLHCNSAPDPNVDGMMGFHWPGNYVGEEVSLAILRAAPKSLLRRSIKSWPATDDPGEKDDWLRRARNVLAVHKATAVLLEMGFATSARDRASLLDPAVQRGVVAALMCGVSRFLTIGGITSLAA